MSNQASFGAPSLQVHGSLRVFDFVEACSWPRAWISRFLDRRFYRG